MAIFGIMVGIFIGRQSTKAGLLEPPPNYTALLSSENSNQNVEYKQSRHVASEDRAPTSINPEPFYFSIRVSSSDSLQDAQAEAKKFEKKCGVSFVKYSSVHQKHLVYCGRFDDLQSAEKVSAELTDVRQILVRLYPNE